MNERPPAPQPTEAFSVQQTGTNPRSEESIRRAMATLNQLIKSYNVLLKLFNASVASLETVLGWGNHSEAGYELASQLADDVNAILEDWAGSDSLVQAGVLEATALESNSYVSAVGDATFGGVVRSGPVTFDDAHTYSQVIVGDMLIQSDRGRSNSITVGVTAGSNGNWALIGRDAGGTYREKFGVVNGANGWVGVTAHAGAFKVKGDNLPVMFGADDDVQIKYDGTDLLLTIDNGSTSSNLWDHGKLDLGERSLRTRYFFTNTMRPRNDSQGFYFQSNTPSSIAWIDTANMYWHVYNRLYVRPLGGGNGIGINATYAQADSGIEYEFRTPGGTAVASIDYGANAWKVLNLRCMGSTMAIVNSAGQWIGYHDSSSARWYYYGDSVTVRPIGGSTGVKIGGTYLQSESANFEFVSPSGVQICYLDATNNLMRMNRMVLPNW